jgi:hypothetical protein
MLIFPLMPILRPLASPSSSQSPTGLFEAYAQDFNHLTSKLSALLASDGKTLTGGASTIYLSQARSDGLTPCLSTALCPPSAAHFPTTHSSIPAEPLRSLLRKVASDLDESDELLSQLEVELPSIPNSVRPTYTTKFKGHKAQLDKLKRQLVCSLLPKHEIFLFAEH